MTFILLATISALGAALWWRGNRRAGQILSACALALFMLIGCGLVPAWLLANLQSRYKPVGNVHWDRQNAIVLLGAGTERASQSARLEVDSHSYSRLIKTVLMYAACKQDQGDCKVIFASGTPASGSPRAAELYANQLLRLGIPAQDLIAETRGTGTWQSAKFTSVLLRQLRVERVVLISSAARLRRAELYFSHFGIDLTAARADYLNAEISVLPLAANFTVTDQALHEYVGMTAYYLFNALGVISAATRPALIQGDAGKASAPRSRFSWRKTA